MITGKQKQAVYFTFCKILSSINIWIPKNKNKILFFSTTGLYDNSEALYSYLLEHGYHKKYHITCALRNPGFYKKYGSREVRFISVFFSIPDLLTSKFIFYHNEALAVMPSPKQISIDFWHATTLKKINCMLAKNKGYRYDFFTYITATSELFRPIFAEAFGCKAEQVIINGHPRNDYLFSDFNELPKLGMIRNQYKKLFFWFPTYRISYNRKQIDVDKTKIHETGLPIFHTQEELIQLNNYLKEHDSFMFIKIHPAQLTYQFNYTNMDHIHFLSNTLLEKAGVRLYCILKEGDALITDYSSVFFDFLLLDRPIGFTVDDMKSYSENRGFVFEHPLDYMPGDVIKDLNSFYLFLENCMNGIDTHQKKREHVNRLANAYTDGENRRRILEYAGITNETPLK